MHLHPAIRLLLRYQSLAKTNRFRRAFSSRRKLALSILALGLAAVWIGNVVLSIVFREPTPPERFATLVPTGLLVYSLWHLIKPAFKRPEGEIEWTDAERELVCAGPFRRRDVLAYHLAGILNASVVKAACFTVLMLPDLSRPLAGFIGGLLALLLVDLFRLLVEISAFGMSRRAYLTFRAAIVALVVGVLTSTLVIAFCAPHGWRGRSELATLSILYHLFASADVVLQSWPGQAALVPFRLLASVIVTQSIDGAWLLSLFGSIGLVAATAWLVVRLDEHFQEQSRRRERAQYPPQESSGEAQHAHFVTGANGVVPWWGGVGPIAWRQSLGAWKYRSSLAVALALPAALALLPVMIFENGRQAFVQVTAALVFYSFLLLPTALKFDFRRDIQRMLVLKTLPIRPTALALGQIAVPAMLAWLFQASVLLATLLIRPFPLWMFAITLAMLAPLNTLIFAIDNLVFLYYPYRLNQEGIEIFLRTTLTFTAKGLFFTLGLVVTFLWSFAANRFAFWWGDAGPSAAAIFVLGGAVMLLSTAWSVVLLLARAYVRFDPSQDTPS